MHHDCQYLSLCDIVSQSDRFELVVTGAAIATAIGNMIAYIVYASYSMLLYVIFFWVLIPVFNR